ncbi:MAG: dihydropteroate synthase [Candidatus Omnitrophota bacterium]
MTRDLSLKECITRVGARTRIMGILNVTPDSFSDGGECVDVATAVKRAVEMQAIGADIIDIGGESSRPGSKSVSDQEEIKRVMPVIMALKEIVKIPISIDTCKSGVAREALKEGVSIVNDITALKGDSRMARVISEYGAAVVLMHMSGTPEVMQEEPFYADVIEEIYSCLSVSIEVALTAGIRAEKIIVDPGIGFGKTLKHNLTILRELRRFKRLGKPILVGVSRKSFIGELTGKGVNDRVFGTVAGCAAAIMNGADIIRVHDVARMRDVACVIDAITKGD